MTDKMQFQLSCTKRDRVVAAVVFDRLFGQRLLARRWPMKPQRQGHLHDTSDVGEQSDVLYTASQNKKESL